MPIQYEKPMHPYTKALISAILGDLAQVKRIVLEGEVPSPITSSGCRFHQDALTSPQGVTEKPVYRRLDAAENFVACHRAEQILHDLN